MGQNELLGLNFKVTKSSKKKGDNKNKYIAAALGNWNLVSTFEGQNLNNFAKWT